MVDKDTIEFKLVSNFLYDSKTEEAFFSCDAGNFTLKQDFEDENQRFKFVVSNVEESHYYEGFVKMEVFSDYVLSKFKENPEKYKKLILNLIKDRNFSFEDSPEENLGKLTFRIKLDDEEYDYEQAILFKILNLSDNDLIKKSIDEMTSRLNSNVNKLNIISANVDEQLKLIVTRYDEKITNLYAKIDEISKSVKELKFNQEKEKINILERDQERRKALGEKINDSIKFEIDKLSERVSNKIYEQNQRIEQITSNVRSKLYSLNSVSIPKRNQITQLIV